MGGEEGSADRSVVRADICPLRVPPSRRVRFHEGVEISARAVNLVAINRLPPDGKVD